ncbi:MAG: OmpA family protein [Hyphomicrobiales bacterium]|nr:OmpA family protein [Hyphomicrobiales bacterium]
MHRLRDADKSLRGKAVRLVSIGVFLIGGALSALTYVVIGGREPVVAASPPPVAPAPASIDGDARKAAESPVAETVEAAEADRKPEPPRQSVLFLPEAPASAVDVAENAAETPAENSTVMALAKVSLAAAQLAAPSPGEMGDCATARALAKTATIYFPMSGSTVPVEYHAALKQFAATVAKCPDAKVDVGGHSDRTGESIANLQLSWQRAQSVINFMKAQGFETSQFLPVGYSNLRPSSLEPTSLGQAKNRRVEFTVR